MNEKYNVSSSPHIRDKVTSSNIMLYVVIALLPATFFGIWNFRHENAWILVVVTTAAAVLSEYLYEKLMHKPITINDFSAVVTGLLLGMNLPSTIPIWMVILGSAFSIIIVKQLFGGIGKNLVNPAITARIVLFISFATEMTTWPLPRMNQTADALTGATPLGVLAEGNPVDLEVVRKGFLETADKYDYITMEGSGGILCPLCFDERRIQLRDPSYRYVHTWQHTDIPEHLHKDVFLRLHSMQGLRHRSMTRVPSAYGPPAGEVRCRPPAGNGKPAPGQYGPGA